MASALAISTRCISATREAHDEARRAHLEPDAPEERSRLVPLLAPVDEPEASRLPAEVQVLRDGEVGGERELLVDHGHAEVLGVAGPVELDRLAGELDPPPGWPLDLREELHEGGLAGPVLPGDHVDLARQDVQVHAVHREHPGELLGDVQEPNNRGAGLGRPRLGQRHATLLSARQLAATRLRPEVAAPPSGGLAHEVPAVRGARYPDLRHPASPPRSTPQSGTCRPFVLRGRALG